MTIYGVEWYTEATMSNFGEPPSIGEGIGGVFAILLLVSVFVIAPIVSVYDWAREFFVETRVDCQTEVIEHKTVRVDDHDRLISIDQVKTTGFDGWHETCKNRLGNTIKDERKEPVDEVILVGKKIQVNPSPVIPTHSSAYATPNYGGYRVGAWCDDGTWSNATGRGACSHHGGVAEWVYK